MSVFAGNGEVRANPWARTTLHATGLLGGHRAGRVGTMSARVRECHPNGSRDTASVRGRYTGNPAGRARSDIVLLTTRLILLPLTRLDESQHARASNDAADARRDTR